MKRLLPLAIAILLCTASFASAAKLAPQQNTLQPLPSNVQPAVSENVQRTASPADIQTIENVQTEEQNSASPAQQPSPLPGTPFAPISSSDSTAFWIALVIALVIAGGIVWLWKSF